MKKLIGLFLLLIFCISCEKGGEEPDIPVPEQPYDYAEFWGYHVKDTTGFQIETLKTIHSNDTTWLFAIKNKKPWFGMFNENTKEQLDEWLGAASYSLKNQTSIPFKPFKISDGFIFFIEYPNGETIDHVDFFTCEPFILQKNKAIPLKSYDNIVSGNSQQFSVLEIDNNILIYHSSNRGYIYSIEGEELVNKVVIKYKQIDDDYDFLSGFKQEKAWLGIYKDNKLIQEYVGNEFYDRNKKIYKGYGEYEDYHVEEFLFGRLLKTDWGYIFAPEVTYSDPFYITLDLFICKDGKMKRMDAPSYEFLLSNWYDGSFLTYEYSSKIYSIYSSKGVLILQEKWKINNDSAPFYNNAMPVSFTEYIEYERGSISRHNLLSNQYSPIWKQTIATIQDNSKVTWNLLDNQSDIWIYQVDILNYDGSKQEINFSININTGDIKQQ